MSTAGLKATFKELTEIMNEKTQSPSEARPELELHYKQVYNWWNTEGGMEKSPFEIPRLTDEHKKQRVNWVKAWAYFLDEEFPVLLSG